MSAAMITHTDFWTIIGIVVSLFLFYFSYRQTIGASRERAHTANSEIDSIIFKRVVLDGLALTRPMIAQLIEGKALSHRVRASNLHSIGEIVNVLFTSTLESDFVPTEKRTILLETILGIPTSSERGAAKEADAIAAETAVEGRRHTEVLVAFMAITTSLLGGVVAILPRLAKISDHNPTPAGKQELYTVLLVSVASFLLALLSFVFFRLREPREEPERPVRNPSGASTEREVLKILHEFHVPTSLGGPDSAYDFDAEIDGKKTLIEVKSWTRRIPPSLIRITIRRMKNLIDLGKGDQSFVVTKDPIAVPELTGVDSKVKVLSLKELRNFLAHRGVSN
jgi:hypothetical protein